MPNYVFNSLSLKGKDEEILDITKNLEGEDTILDFNKVIKIPETLNDEEAYFYKIENWGCKWNAIDIEFDDNTYYFLTPWNPPIPVIKKISLKYPKTHFTLEWAEETGSDSGSITFLNGRKINSTYYKDKNNELYINFWGLDEDIEGEN